MSKQTFMQGALLLIAAGFVTKLLGFINRIVMARILGPEGVGLYMMAVPILVLVITLTRLGLPVAISKLVAEADAQGDHARIKRILIVSLTITATLSIVFTSVTLIGADIISTLLLTDDRAYYPLLAITPIVPIVAISSVIKGYFQGKQNMRPSAYSQVIEQVVRIALVAGLAMFLLPLGVEYAAAGAMISVVIGELASMLYLIMQFRKGKKGHWSLTQGFINQIRKGKQTFQDLMRISLPTTGSGLIGSLSWTFEAILVAQSLTIAGITTAVATAQYGLFSGYAIPLVMLPMFITQSLSVSLVPAVSEAASHHDNRLIQRRIYQALRLALVCGAPCTVIMYMFAEPLMRVIYDTPEAATLLKLLAPFFLLLYFQGPLQAALQGLDMAKTAMMNTLIGAIVKTGAIFVLASRPELGIYGAALAININVVLVTLLHFFSVLQTIRTFTIDAWDIIKTGIAMSIIALIGKQTYHYLLQSFASDLLSLLGALCAVGGAYVILMVFMRMLGKQDVERLPFVGKCIAPLFPRR